MAFAFTDYFDQLTLEGWFNAGALPTNTDLYVGLSTTAVAQNGTGYTEPSGAGYARVAVATTTSGWSVVASSGSPAAGYTVQNAAAITFPESTGSWGTITNMFIADSATVGDGNVLATAALTVSQTISSGDTVTFNANNLTLSID